MTWILDFFRSPMGKKAVMAVTGLVLFGFVLGHMVGNLKLYAGAEKLNGYAEGLRDLGAPFFGHGEALWIVRAGLLLAVVLHIVSAWQVSRLSQKARPIPYRRKQPQAATYASRTMRWGGVILLLFIVYHLLHLTVGSVHGDFVPHDVYHNVVTAFRNPWVAAVYVVANLALGLHLYHGVFSLLQTLGVAGPRVDALRGKAAAAFAIIVTAGNVSFPLSVLTGIVGG